MKTLKMKTLKILAIKIRETEQLEILKTPIKIIQTKHSNSNSTR